MNLPAPSAISAHAIVGGASAELAGGNFFNGALAAGVAKGTTLGVAKFYPDSVVANGAATAAAGAFTAEISGGDPALAAYRAGLGYAYNYCGHGGGCSVLRDYQSGAGEALMVYGQEWLKVSAAGSTFVLGGPMAAGARVGASWIGYRAWDYTMRFSPRLGAAAANPATIEGTVDFIDGFAMEGPPGPTLPGVAGFTTRKGAEFIKDMW